MHSIDIVRSETDARQRLHQSLVDNPAWLLVQSEGWRAWSPFLVSAAIICAIAAQIDHLDFHRIWALMPASPLFWVSFAAWYLVGPATDWIIFRRLWTLPVAGFPALLRKTVSNELLAGYVGEIYFYGWVRWRAGLTGSPFGAIKDVAMLSALVGNLVTLAMFAATWPLLSSLHLGLHSELVMLSVGMIISTPVIMMLFRRRLFTLPASNLWFIAAVQLGRILTMTTLVARCWHLVLPTVGISWWLLLATMRLLISRLPFLPNRELVFTGAAIFIVGKDAEIADLLALWGGLSLAVQLLFGGILSVSDLTRLAVGRK